MYQLYTRWYEQHPYAEVIFVPARCCQALELELQYLTVCWIKRQDQQPQYMINMLVPVRLSNQQTLACTKEGLPPSVCITLTTTRYVQSEDKGYWSGKLVVNMLFRLNEIQRHSCFSPSRIDECSGPSISCESFEATTYKSRHLCTSLGCPVPRSFQILSLCEDTVLPLFTHQLTSLPVGSATHRTT